MKIFWAVSAMVLSFALTASGQVTTSPTPEDEVVKISTKLVQIDVTVTDRNGKIVRDLRPGDIEIYQNGKKQEITNFSFISDGQRGFQLTKKPVPNEPAQPQLATPLKAENVNRTIVLIVGKVSFQSMYYARRSLKKFVDEQMMDGDLVAIVRTSAGSGVLQQFTTDKRMLYAAIEDLRWSPISSGGGALGRIVSPMSVVERSQDGQENAYETFREGEIVIASLQSLDRIIQGVRDLPGRKSALLLSDGFSTINRKPGEGAQTQKLTESVRRVVDSANRASVTINTIDARGLFDKPFSLVADSWRNLSGPQVQAAMKPDSLQVMDTQQGPRELTRQTGGLSIVNSNDLSRGIRQILDNQSYYLVGYEPDDQTFDPKIRRYHRLEVKVKRRGLDVRYRSGFFGFKEEEIQKPKITGGQRFVTALLSPFAANDISIRLNAIFNNDSVTGSHIRSLLHVNAGDLTFKDEADGTKAAAFDVIAVGIDQDGNAVDSVNKSYTLTANKAVYEKYLADGFVYGFTFPVSSTGIHQLRVALRDRASGKIGSANQLVEVADIAKKRLALSGVFMQNLSIADWTAQNTSLVPSPLANRLTDTSRRKFKRGTVLTYAFFVFNATLTDVGRPSLTLGTRVFSDGKMIVDGEQRPIPADGQTDFQRIGAGGSLNLGKDLRVGEYLLEIKVKDTLANEKQNISTQIIQFDIVE